VGKTEDLLTCACNSSRSKTRRSQTPPLGMYVRGAVFEHLPAVWLCSLRSFFCLALVSENGFIKGWERLTKPSTSKIHRIRKPTRDGASRRRPTQVPQERKDFATSTSQSVRFATGKGACAAINARLSYALHLSGSAVFPTTLLSQPTTLLSQSP
jgi:hypothetical protein